jgi:hypothetical protein
LRLKYKLISPKVAHPKRLYGVIIMKTKRSKISQLGIFKDDIPVLSSAVIYITKILVLSVDRI